MNRVYVFKVSLYKKEIQRKISILMNAEYITDNGMSYPTYRGTIAQKYEDTWDKKFSQVKFSPSELDLIHLEGQTINIVAFSADWCPDCQASIPILAKMAEISDSINLFILERELNIDILSDFKILGRKRVPFVLFMDDEFQEATRWVERSAFGYRLVMQAKIRATEEGSDNYSPLRKQLFKEHSTEMFEENKRELIESFKKAYSLINSTAPVDKVPNKQNIVNLF